ncbi:hypothetical protein KP509_27G021500 [Ceratopteris richardii]|uniref:FAF domain-containing protein n=1 Tax=Ceratopteris richardii TaxID=49495 RepID=A0A8T2RGZ9_CERRI|nr:hypothetical protein KP509_27G021500 [Ceratopteris richardii]
MSLEDYWEDASVCIGSNLPDFCDRSFSPSIDHDKEYEPPRTEANRLKSPASPDVSVPVFSPNGQHDHLQSGRFSLDLPTSSKHLARQFPPPITVYSIHPIKQGGRFVLKDTSNSHPPLYGSSIKAERQQGRLRLHLIDTDEDACDHGKGENIGHAALPELLVSSQSQEENKKKATNAASNSGDSSLMNDYDHQRDEDHVLPVPKKRTLDPEMETGNINDDTQCANISGKVDEHYNEGRRHSVVMV